MLPHPSSPPRAPTHCERNPDLSTSRRQAEAVPTLGLRFLDRVVGARTAVSPLALVPTTPKVAGVALTQQVLGRASSARQNVTRALKRATRRSSGAGGST